MFLIKNINPSIVLIQPRKTSPFITERLLMGRKESNQTNKPFNVQIFVKSWSMLCAFQVITGGHYDVDMELTAPNGKTLYKDVKKQYDSFTWNTDMKGVHKFCFSNEFSTFSHKVVYFDFQAGDEEPLIKGMDAHATAMTMVSRARRNLFPPTLLKVKKNNKLCYSPVLHAFIVA